METSNTTIAPAAEGHTQKHIHHSSTSNDQHAIPSFHFLIIIIVSVISVIVLVALLLLILMLKRLKSSKGSHGNSSKSFDDNGGSINNNCGSSRFIAHTTINFTSSPYVKGGCLSGSLSRSNTPANGNCMRDKGVVQVFTYKELEMATGKFSDDNVIGNGRLGAVYKGVLSGGTVAAIKKLHIDGKQRERAFRMEVDLLSCLHSPYLVELLGYCADQNHRLLISEYMPNGTLQQHLHHYLGNQYRPLDWGTRLIIALDCARALEFLHEQATPPVIHRDFKSSNILLDQNFRAKVTDFGLAKMVSDKINGQISTRILGTTGYLAPEYASTGKLTTKSDVYSYGVVLLELLTGRVPVDNNRPPGEHVLVSWALPRLTCREKVMQMVDPSLQGQFSKKELVQIAAIAAMCVQPEAEYRPLMTDVVQSLIPLVKNNATAAISFGSSRLENASNSYHYQ